MASDDKVSGPLGFWTFPLLNSLVQMNSDAESESNQGGSKAVETAKVIRDSNGQVQEVVVIKE